MQFDIFTEDENIIALCKDYWATDDVGNFVFRIKDLSERYSISGPKISSLIRKNSVGYSEEHSCDMCGKLYPKSSRSDAPYYFTSWRCGDCKAELAQAIEDEKRECLINIYQDALEKVPTFAQLSFKDKIFLVSCCHFCARENMRSLAPLNSVKYGFLSPTQSFSNKVISSLYRENLLSPDCLNNDTSVIAYEDGCTGVYLNSCELVVPGLIGDELHTYHNSAIEELYSECFLKNKNKESFFGLIEEVMMEEVISFLNHCLEEHGLHFSAGEKTKTVILEGLHSFSVSELYSLVWSAAKNASSFKVRKGVANKHAANSAVTILERNISRAVNEGWDVKPFSRNFKLPQSAISFVIFDKMLAVPDGGFKMKLEDLKVIANRFEITEE